MALRWRIRGWCPKVFRSRTMKQIRRVVMAITGHCGRNDYLTSISAFRYTCDLVDETGLHVICGLVPRTLKYWDTILWIPWRYPDWTGSLLGQIHFFGTLDKGEGEYETKGPPDQCSCLIVYIRHTTPTSIYIAARYLVTTNVHSIRWGTWADCLSFTQARDFIFVRSIFA